MLTMANSLQHIYLAMFAYGIASSVVQINVMIMMKNIDDKVRSIKYICGAFILNEMASCLSQTFPDWWRALMCLAALGSIFVIYQSTAIPEKIPEMNNED